MDDQTKEKLAKIAKSITTLKVSLAADYQKLVDIVNDEENRVDALETQDSDKAIEEREKCEELRKATNRLDKVIGILEEDVITGLEE